MTQDRPKMRWTTPTVTPVTENSSDGEGQEDAPLLTRPTVTGTLSLTPQQMELVRVAATSPRPGTTRVTVELPTGWTMVKLESPEGQAALARTRTMLVATPARALTEHPLMTETSLSTLIRQERQAAGTWGTSPSPETLAARRVVATGLAVRTRRVTGMALRMLSQVRGPVMVSQGMPMLVKELTTVTSPALAKPRTALRQVTGPPRLGMTHLRSMLTMQVQMEPSLVPTWLKETLGTDPL